jgi:membrane protein
VVRRLNLIIRFITEDIWRFRSENTAKRQFILIRILRVVILAIREFVNDKCAQKASALTYYSLLSIVPLVAMAFGIAKGFGFESVLESQLMKSLYGQEAVIEWIMDFAHKYLSSIKGGMIAGVGFAMLLWSMMNVLGNVELSFNEIWEVKRSRSMVRKFSDYVSIMLIGILFLVSSGSMIVSFTGSLGGYEMFRYVWLTASTLLPYFLTIIMFTMLFFILPNTKVKFTSALVGGIISGALFLVVQYFYIYFQVGMSRYNAIYGSFAAFPLFLIWMQTSWLIVLFGAELSFAFQNASNFEYEKDTRFISHSYKRVVLLYIAQYIVKRFERGEKAATADEIVNDLHLPLKLVVMLVYEMIDAGILAEVHSQSNQANSYQPAMDINKLTVVSVINMVDSHGAADFHVADNEQIVRLKEIMGSFETSLYEQESNILLKDI